MNGMNERRESYRAAVKKGSAWLAATQLPDGSYGPDALVLGDLETAAICLQLMGYPENAYALVRYIRKNLFNADGTFQQTADEGTLAEWPYAPSWAVVSAHITGYYDVAYPAMKEILRFQDAKTGGLFGHPRLRERGEGVIAPTVSMVAGTAAIVTGQLEAASRIGDYLLHLIAVQPDIGTCFFPFYDTRSGLVTEGSPEFAPAYFGTFDRKAPMQHYWLPGFMIAFLSDLALSTGQEKYLDGAKTMFEFGAGCHPNLYTNLRSHKYVWGCARLYHATGDAKYLEPGLRIADYLVETQEPDGTWWYKDFIPDRSQQTLGWSVDISSQFCIWLVKLLQVL